MVVYERVPKNYGTVLTFALSALWHGFYPGYYMTFASGALIVMAARKVIVFNCFHYVTLSFICYFSLVVYSVITSSKLN